MPTKANGAIIRRLREAKGLNCTQLAQAAGLDRILVWKVENGRLDGSPETRLKIAAALNASVEDITYFVPPAQRSQAAAERQAA